MKTKESHNNSTVDPSEYVRSDEPTESPAVESSSSHTGEKKAEAEVYFTELFLTLVNETVGSLPYKTRLTSNSGQSITLNNFVTFIEQHQQMSYGMKIAELNLIIEFLYSLPFRNVRKLMTIVENNEEQHRLWTIKNPE